VITERKRAEEKLRQSEAELRQLACFWICTFQGHCSAMLAALSMRKEARSSLTKSGMSPLEVASLAGVSFTAHAIALGTTIDQEKFEDLCEELSRRQHMVRQAGSHRFPDGTISQCYEFAHALYREVFYRRQAPGRRAKLQLSIGECA
jgi:hypothetical protein